jgi:diadenosine tetraphosphate (Ap4A) HIT family hydrolase
MDVNISTNQGVLLGQSVPHLHIHIILRCTDDSITNPWTGQEEGHYKIKGKLKHSEDIYRSLNKTKSSSFYFY